MQKTATFVFILFYLITVPVSFSAEASKDIRIQTAEVQTGDHSVLIDYDFGSIVSRAVEYQNQTFTATMIPEEGLTYDYGKPVLPRVSRFIIVPPTAGLQLQVTSSTPVEIRAEHPPLLNLDEDIVLLTDHEAGELTGIYPPVFAEMSEPVVVRGVRMVMVTTYPMQYNAETNTYLHRETIQTEVVYTDEAPVNPVLDPNRRGMSREFIKYIDALASNPEVLHLDDVENVSPWAGHYAIAAHTNCVIPARPFIEWRRKAGYKVDILNLTQQDAGNVRNSIRALYNGYVQAGVDPFDNLLIIGDRSDHQGCGPGANWIVHAETGESLWGNPQHADYKYALLEGNDLHPDVGYARWASGNAQLMALNVGRTLAYEANPYMQNTDWFTHGGVGSTHWGNGEDSAWHVTVNTNVRWGAEVLEHLGYTDIDTYEDYNWDQQAQRYGPWVRDLLNGRTNVVLSRAECYYWRQGFAGVNNNVVFPIRLNSSGHGEWATWNMTRTGDGNNLKGWVAATCGWGGPPTAPMSVFWLGLVDGVMQHDMNFGWGHIYGKTNFEQFFPNANFRGQPSYNIVKTDVDAYGDPGIQPWRGVPVQLDMEHVESISTEARLVEVYVHEPGDDEAAYEGARVSLYVPGDLPGAAAQYAAHEVFQMTMFTGPDGYARFVFEDGNEFDRGTMYVTLTGRDILPRFGEIDIITPQIAIEVGAYEFDEVEGDGDPDLSPGETFTFAVTAANVGNRDNAEGVTAVVSSLSPWVEVEENEISFGDIADGETVEGDEPVTIRIHASCPDGEARPSTKPVLRVVFTSGENTWQSAIELLPVAPNFKVFAVPGGNIVPTEMDDLDIDLANVGGLNSSEINAELFSLGMGVGVVEATASFPVIRAGRHETLVGNQHFTISGNSVVVPGSINPMMLVLTTEEGFVDTAYFDLQVGRTGENCPQGPDKYGYICFDDTDDAWEIAPDYEWVEISREDDDRDFNGTLINAFDGRSEQNVGESVVIDLPFDNQYYGELYDQVTVCTNGYICMGDQANITNFQNWPLDQGIAAGAGTIAPFWDWLQLGNTGQVYYFYDEEDARFIIEWYRLRHREGGNSDLTFQVILYDHDVWITETGDQNILMQYKTIAQARGPQEGEAWEKNVPYASVGISSPDGTTGLSYTFNNLYPVTSPALANRRAILYSTSPRYKACTIVGTVTDAETGQPVQGVIVATEHGFTALTDENGEYTINGALAEVPFDITARKLGYNDSTLFDFEIPEDEEETIDFSLLHPEFTPSTERIADELPIAQISEHEFTLTNTGNGFLTWSVARELRGDANADPWEFRRSYPVGNILGDSRLQGVVFIEDRFYIAGSNNRDPQIYVIDREGELVDQYAQFGPGGGYGHKDLAYDGEWIWGSGAADIYAFTPEGELMLQIDGPYNPNNNFAWDPDREIMWVASTTSNIIGIDREGNEVDELDRRGLRIYGLAYWPEDPDGCGLYIYHKVSEVADQMIHKMNPDNGDTVFVEIIEPELGGDPTACYITNQFDVYSWVFISISNDGPNDRIDVWQLDVRRDWMQINPTTGVLEPDETEDFLLTLNSTGLPEVEFVGDLVYTHNAEGGETLIEISLTVLPAGPRIEDRVLELAQGWNMISLNVDPENRDVRAILQPLVAQGLVIMFKDGQGRFYLPEHNFCNIPGWGVGEGFLIGVTEATSLEVEGLVIPPETPIALDQGWNMKAYFPRNPIETTVALAGIRDQLLLAKDALGRFYLPEFGFCNMGNMSEGKAYQFNVRADVDLIYQDGQEQVAFVAAMAPVVPNYYETHAPTGVNMSVLVQGTPDNIGWELAAFSKTGKIVGSGRFDAQGNCGLAVWGDNPATQEVEGLIDGETAKLQVWTGQMEIPVQLAEIGDLVFKTDGIEVGKFMMNEIPAEFGLTSIYPNPFNATTRLNFALPTEGLVKLSIYDLAGREVMRLIDGDMKAGYHSAVWNASAISSGVYFARLSGSSNVKIAKLMLLK